MNNLHSKLSRMKIQSGSIQLVPTQITDRGLSCISSTDLSVHITKTLGLICSTAGNPPFQFEGILSQSIPTNGFFLIELEMKQDSYYKVLQTLKNMQAGEGPADVKKVRRARASSPELTVETSLKPDAQKENVPPKSEYYAVPI
ncbi:MAG: hypothetical protein JWQ35_265, partial [Bacteriovoracaceae bacterium]|nr:hypothetical protein [Bacteriovoracaceae bacterium]